MKPRFDHLVGGNDDNKLKLGYSDEANSLYAAPATYTSKQPDAVERTARSEVLQLGGDLSDRTALLGQFEVQFGRFKGKTFKWLLENGLGYSAWFVTSMAGETATSASLSVNKHAFKEYLESFPEGKEAIAVKKTEKTKNLQLWFRCLVAVRFHHTQSPTDYNAEIRQKINSPMSRHLHQVKNNLCFSRVGVFSAV